MEHSMQLTPNHAADVKLFHDKFGLVTPEEFTFIERELYSFRVLFFNEEFEEYRQAYKQDDFATQIDSLIDLVYITAGCALLHGIKPAEYDLNVSFRSTEPRRPHTGFSYLRRLNQSIYCYEKRPHPLSTDENNLLCEVIENTIKDYSEAYLEKSEKGIKEALADLHLCCIYGKNLMGFANDYWTLLWDDVQRANMSKERALKASDSKRGSTYDVIKPAGWIPPKTQEFIDLFLGQEHEPH